MTQAEQLADFTVRASFADMSGVAAREIKIRVLDALGCALGALGSPLIQLLRGQTNEFGGNPFCTLIGGPKSAPDRAAFFNCAMVRYLDFNDSYLAKGETCHPSDNLGPILAASEYANRSGRDLMTALAVAYQVQCRLCDVAPVRDHGFDHVTLGAYSVACGVAKALRLNEEQTANAIGISGAAYNALRVTRTGRLSHWKGLAFAGMAAGVTHAAFLAMRGVTGPVEIFEGNKGFMDSVAGPFVIDWSREDLERVTRTVLKKYNAEMHSQSAIECVLELRHEAGLRAADIEEVRIDIFDVAHKIIGGGEEGSKTEVRTKEQADHSLPYVIAAALLDGEVTPAQYAPDRIGREDVQSLLRQVKIHPSPEYSASFPHELPCKVTVQLRNGRVLQKEKRSYPGFVDSPMPWNAAEAKFHRLAEPHVGIVLRNEVIQAVANLEQVPVPQLTALLAKCGGPAADMKIA